MLEIDARPGQDQRLGEPVGGCLPLALLQQDEAEVQAQRGVVGVRQHALFVAMHRFGELALCERRIAARPPVGGGDHRWSGMPGLRLDAKGPAKPAVDQRRTLNQSVRRLAYSAGQPLSLRDQRKALASLAFL